MNEISSDQKGGYAEVAYLIKQQRAKKTPFFFFFGGGSIGPSKLSSFDRGSHTIDLLNGLEPDVMAVAKRDLSFFEDELSLRSYEAAFPFVTTNVLDKETNKTLNGLLKSVIAQQGDYKIGVLSTMEKAAIGEYNLKRTRITDKVSTVKLEADKLRKKKVDLVILINASKEDDVLTLLNNGVVDLILQKDGHVSQLKNRQIPTHPHYIFIDQLDKLALINITGIKSKNLGISTKFIAYSELDKDSKTQRRVDQYKARLSNLLDEVIGSTAVSMNTQRIVVRKQESAFTNLITDALKEYTDADIALLNGGSIRGEAIYTVGQNISRRHVMSELPYRSRIVLLKVRGKRIKQAIEHGLAGLEQALGRFLHVSGLTVTYNSRLPAGKRIISVTHDGKEILDDSTYKVAMSDYLATGGDDFVMWRGSEGIEYSRLKNMLISDIVTNYIRQKSIISSKIENRLVDKAQGN